MPDRDPMQTGIYRSPKERIDALAKVITGYRALHDGLSDMIEGGRLKSADIPDDYQWLVSMLAKLGSVSSTETT